MGDWRGDETPNDRMRRDRDDGPSRDRPSGEGRPFKDDRERGGQERSEGQDAWGARAGEDSGRMDSGAGDQGQDRYGHSGGFQSGYGGQSGKAAFGPLSQGSTYGQGGAGYGHSGWTSHAEPSDGPRGRGPGAGGDYGFRGQGGGGQQWSGRSGGSYGQGDAGRSAQRSQARTDQYDPNDQEGFVAYGRAYGDAAREPDPKHKPEGDRERDHGHDHEPAYSHWREHQLSSHDRDYSRWRAEQAKRYDEEYKGYRDTRHETFSKGFQDWRSGRQDGAQASAGASSSASATSVGGVDQVGDNVRNVTDGGPGDAGKAGAKHDADKPH